MPAFGDTVDTAHHPYWGRIRRRHGYDQWEADLPGDLPDGRTVPIRVVFDDPDDTTVQANYAVMRRRWPDLWPRILSRTQAMKAAYGLGHVPLRPDSDWFSLRPPTEPLDAGAPWTVMLQADEAGWLLDFDGWDDAGGQPVV